jgi:hypothetical protein
LPANRCPSLSKTKRASNVGSSGGRDCRCVGVCVCVFYGANKSP